MADVGATTPSTSGTFNYDTAINQFEFIIFFVIIALFFGMIAGEKSLLWFLVIVLVGMLLAHWQPIDTFLQTFVLKGGS